MAERGSWIDAMIDAIDPEGIEMFATAQGDQLEALKAGFNAYVQEKSWLNGKEHGEVFDEFIEKIREVYLTI